MGGFRRTLVHEIMGNLCGTGETEPLTIHYFDGLRSRGEVVRMTAAYGGIQYTDKLLSPAQWKEFKEAQGKLDPPGIQHLPYITKPDGKTMVETCVIMKYFAELGKKFVVDEANAKLAERSNSDAFMIVDPFLNLDEATRKAFGIEATKEDALKMIAEGWKTLASELGDKKFFSGDKPGYGEVFVFHNIDNGLTLAEKDLNGLCGEEVVKKLKAFHKTFSELDGIKQYLESRPKEFGMPGSPATPQPPAEPAK